MQDFHQRQGRNNSALLQTDRGAETYALLEIEEYLHRLNGQKLLDYELSEPDRMLSELNSGYTETTETAQVEALWE